MPLAIAPAASTVPDVGRINLRRVVLTLGTAAAVAIPVGLGQSAASDSDGDLVQLLQFMAVLKGVFAVVAFAACYWRLARPATAWREIVYVTGPGVMAAGSVCLWQLSSAGVSAIMLHLGMFALLAAALTDAAFFPMLNGKRSGARA